MTCEFRSPAAIHADLNTLSDRLKLARTVAIFTHMRPDPDAIGSQVAAGLALHALGITPTLVDLSPVPPTLAFLYPVQPILERISLTAEISQFPPREFDLILILDTCTKAQLERAWPYLECRKEKILVLDHHRTRDTIGRLIVADVSAAACTELVADLVDALGIGLTQDISTALLAGLAADTGWFRFDSVTPRSYTLAARLVAAGAAPSQIYQNLSQRESMAKLALIQHALTNLTWLANGIIALMELSQMDFAATGAASFETDGLTDYPMMVSTTMIVALLSEAPDGIIRVNLRSKHTIDVSMIAAGFGGGGHMRAAGCRLPGPMPSAREAISMSLLNALRQVPDQAAL